MKARRGLFITLISLAMISCQPISKRNSQNTTEEQSTFQSQLSLNDTLNIKTTCLDNSCESISSSDKQFSNVDQRVSCLKTELIDIKFTSVSVSSGVKICPNLNWSNPSQHAYSRENSVMKARIEIPTPSSLSQDEINLDLNLAQEISIDHNENEGVFCEAYGFFKTTDVFEFEDNTLRLLIPARFVKCNVPSI